MLVSNRLGRLPAAVQLRDDLDAERLRADLVELGEHQTWRRQQSFQDGGVGESSDIDWRCLSLRAPAGDAERTDPGGPGQAAFADTHWMAKAPYMAQVLAGLGTELRSVRLMGLAPGVLVPEHQDSPIGLPYGYVRLHVPVVTNPGAILVMDGVEQCWQPGTLWYADFDRPHAVRNTGAANRVHLVIDCAISDELLGLFPESFRTLLPMSEIALQRPVVPLSAAERDDFRCRFSVPRTFVDWGAALEDDTRTDLPAEVTTADGELVLRVEDGPSVALLHVGAGEFRLQGWSEERGLRLGLFDAAPRVVFHTRRGRRRQEVARPAVATAAR
ncbi:aspartyl/asparaginyl beta-hydroxylase domain-containing protein [Streptomyces violaceusniger]|uniref:aspartyl/asparaginyl beta-hydroxylase domain-containing protein n=1 Tax=Streptomyces violaceusniger TaxID=68280 RepID=UPI00343AB982